MISQLRVGYSFSVSHHAVLMLGISVAQNFTVDPSAVCDYGIGRTLNLPASITASAENQGRRLIASD